MQSVGFEELQTVAGVLEENEELRAQVDRMTQELEACRECKDQVQAGGSLLPGRSKDKSIMTAGMITIKDASTRVA